MQWQRGERVKYGIFDASSSPALSTTAVLVDILPQCSVAMAALTPYTYIQCPCSDFSTLGRPSGPNSPTGTEADDDDRTFDPRAPRANYSLYPLEYLLYCEDCHQIRCPRCIAEEIVTYYCPNCLFEVPSSNLKSEGNRSVSSSPSPFAC
jgi:dynactin-4